MAREPTIEPLAGDEVRVVKGRHSQPATFIGLSSRGGKAHIFTGGVHRTVPAGRVTHVRARSAADRAKALEEPMTVADTVRKQLGEHSLAKSAQATHDLVAHEHAHARVMHAIIHLAYHGDEQRSRELTERLASKEPIAAVAADADQWSAPTVPSIPDPDVAEAA